MKPTLSLSMIVKDEEQTLPRCLESIRKYVDEVVIVDTGSQDRTRDVAASFGARVASFHQDEHPDAFALDDGMRGGPPPFSGKHYLVDFAAARNFSLNLTTSDYVMWIDADDIVENAESIPSLLEDMRSRSLDSLFARYVLNETSSMWRDRIVKHGGPCTWHGMVHEVLFPHGKSERTDKFTVRHAKYAGDTSTDVANRNLKIALLQLDRQQANGSVAEPRTLFYLANEMKTVDVEAAKTLYEQYIARAIWREEAMKARLYLGELHEKNGDNEKAINEFSAATVEMPTFPEPWFALARVAYWKKDWHRCIEWTKRGLALGDPETTLFCDRLDRTYKPFGFLNFALNQVGRVPEALEICQKGLAINPSDTHLLQNVAVYKQWIAEHIPGATAATSHT